MELVKLRIERILWGRLGDRLFMGRRGVRFQNINADHDAGTDRKNDDHGEQPALVFIGLGRGLFGFGSRSRLCRWGINHQRRLFLVFFIHDISGRHCHARQAAVWRERIRI